MSSPDWGRSNISLQNHTKPNIEELWNSSAQCKCTPDKISMKLAPHTHTHTHKHKHKHNTHTTQHNTTHNTQHTHTHIHTHKNIPLVVLELWWQTCWQLCAGNFLTVPVDGESSIGRQCDTVTEPSSLPSPSSLNTSYIIISERKKHPLKLLTQWGSSVHTSWSMSQRDGRGRWAGS